jgi:2-oxoglutarate dehydrogenase E2 component (dihydrolipoamide succinyltransferase)
MHIRHMMRVSIVLPDLDLGEQKVTVSNWLVPVGREIVEGDRLLELCAGDVTVDLPAPATGRLIECSVAEGETVAVDQIVGAILVPS